jgi:hypothetical protein
MSESNMRATDAPVEELIAALEPPSKRDDARVLLALLGKITGERARLWGDSIVGFGEYETIYASGRKVNWMRSGFSTRKAKHSLYLMAGYCDDLAAQQRAEILMRLGKHSEGKSCLYINKLADVDLGVLEEMIAADWEAMQRIYP